MAENVAKIVLSAEDRTGAAIASAKAGLSSMQPQVQAASAAMLGFSTAAGAASAAIAAIVVSSKAIDAFNDLADATGSSVENISALDRVARETGGNFDTVSTSLIKFNAALKETDGDNSGTAAALKAIGLSAKELKTLDPSEALRRTAVALASFADDGNKARLTQELFGKSLKDVAPFLKDLADKGELVASVTARQAAEAEIFNKVLYNLQANATDAGRALAVGVVPTLNQLAEEFLGVNDAASGTPIIVSVINTTLQALAVVGANVAYVLKATWNELNGLASQAALIAKLDFKGFNALSTAIREDAERARRELDSFEQRILQGPLKNTRKEFSDSDPRRLSTGDGRQSVDFAKPSKETADRVKDLSKQQEASIQGLAEQLKALSGNTSEFDKVMERLTTGTWKNFDAATRAATLAIAGEIDETKRAIAQSKAWQEQQVETAKEIADAYVAESKAREQGRAAVDDYAKSIADQNAYYALEIGLLGKSDSARKLAIENYRIQIELEKQLEDIRKNAGFDEEQREEMRAKARKTAAEAQAGIANRVGAEDARGRDPLAGFDDALRKYQEESEKVAGQVEATFTKAFQGMEDALVQFVMTGKLNFSDMATAVVADITRIIIKQQIANATASLLGGGSGGGDFLAQGLGALFGGGKATGGPVDPSRYYMVGERGPELFVPNVAGSIVPTDQLGGMGGGSVSVVNHFTVSGAVDNRTQAQIAAQAGMATQRALARNA
jgi:lambda family phage tail tape measure protein